MSEVQKLSQLQADNKMLNIYNSSVSHEMLTPLKCLIAVSKTMEDKT
jgi:hypothetical protein